MGILAPIRPPGVFEVGQLGGGTHAIEGDDVEAVLVPGLAVAEQPGPGEPLEGGPLAEGDRLDARATGGRAAALDLDEGDQRTQTGDQVEVVPAESEAMGLDSPAAPS